MVKLDTATVSRMEDYCDRLRIAMTDAVMSVTALSKEMGISYQAVKKVLDGRSGAFSAENNSKAAAILKVSPDWLATGKLPKHVVAAPKTDQIDITPIISRLSAEAIMLADQLDRIVDHDARVLAMNEALKVVLDHCRRPAEA